MRADLVTTAPSRNVGRCSGVSRETARVACAGAGNVYARGPMRLLIPCLLLLLACTPAPPGADAARAYADALEPLLEENGHVADRLLYVAADVYNGKADAAAARAAWEDDVVPLAEHLRDQAVLVQAPPDWAPSHQTLVEIWTQRAESYRDISEAIDLGDPEVWKKARSTANDAKLREEAWFRDTNQRMQAYGITLDQFP